jgi:phosphoglycolate phosphatase
LNSDLSLMDIRGVIFDLDGTLLDTLDDLADAANAALAHYGFPGHGTSAYKYFVGDGLSILIERILPEKNRTKAEISACMDIFLQMYGRLWDVKSKPYAGIPEMLQQLRAAGLQLGILSNKPHAFTQLCVQRYFGADTFAWIYGQREGTPKKPDPAGALEIAALMQLEPREIAYVGDTSTDMRTGNQAGMLTIGVLWGFRDRQELEDSKAHRIVTHPSEILTHVHSQR